MIATAESANFDPSLSAGHLEMRNFRHRIFHGLLVGARVLACTPADDAEAGDTVREGAARD